MNEATLLRDISACVKDIQETHGLILRRINEIDMGLHKDTSCLSSKHNTTLMDRMIKRVLVLENNEKETNQEVSRLKQCLEKLHKWIKNLELNKGDVVVNLDKNKVLDESCNDSTPKLQTDTSLTCEDLELNQQEDKHEQQEIPNESKNIQVFCNDFQQENDDPDKVLEMVQDNADVGLDLKSSAREINAPVDQPHISYLNPQSILVETDLKTENVTPQEERQYLDNINIWNACASDERRMARESGLLESSGIHTVICVDTSASLLHDYGKSQVNAFVQDYLNGLEESAITMHRRDENVALVTFGKDTHVAQRLTKDYKKVMQVFQNIEFGGPSPMYGGLAMAIAAAESTDSCSASVNGMTINTKIVLITDGKPTDSCMVQGIDVVDNKISDETQNQVLSKVSEIAARPYLNLFVVSVGNANTKFLELMSSVADGKMLRYDEGNKFSRRLLLSALAAPLGPLSSPFSELSGIANTLPVYLTEQDKEHIKELREEGKQSGTGSLGKMLKSVGHDDYYHESTDKTLPQVGSRVVRGPDWIHNDQDGGGPGTIIGHSSDRSGIVTVEWDRNAHVNIYRYSAELGYDILLIDKPREIINERMERIAVGCVVKPGKHFNYKGTNVNRLDRGIVIKVLTSAEDRVIVRWNNFKRVRGEYSYGCQEFYEVELCQTDKPEMEMTSMDNYSKSGKTKSINNKNK